MLIGLLTAVALGTEVDMPPPVLMALMLVEDEDTDAT
jgi:hypothetical protein